MSKKQVSYHVELSSSASPDVVPTEWATAVSVEGGALVFKETAGLEHVTRIYAPGSWISTKRVETEVACD